MEKIKKIKIMEKQNFRHKLDQDFFLIFNFGLKSRFLAQKFKYLILFSIKYSRISSNIGAKMQIFQKVKFFPN